MGEWKWSRFGVFFRIFPTAKISTGEIHIILFCLCKKSYQWNLHKKGIIGRMYEEEIK